MHLSPTKGDKEKNNNRKTRHMNIIFYRNENNEEIEVKSWREADHCIIDCEDAVEILEAGRWIEAHKKSIADYSVFAAYGDRPYVEVHKAAKN